LNANSAPEHAKAGIVKRARPAARPGTGNRPRRCAMNDGSIPLDKYNLIMYPHPANLEKEGGTPAYAP
jgi:hypothetical protein